MDFGSCKKLPLRLLLCGRCVNFASMQVNVELLKEWFADFNVRYFGGSLPVPAFAVGRSRTQLGCMSCKVRRRMFSKSYTDYTIRLSNYYDADERHFKNVLLHEMIHLCITVEANKGHVAARRGVPQDDAYHKCRRLEHKRFDKDGRRTAVCRQGT